MIESTDLINDPKVVVKAITKFQQVIDLAGRDTVAKVNVGDTLLSVDGKPFKQFFEENQFKTGGANVFGGMRSALNSISFIEGLRFPMPNNDNVTFSFSKPNGQNVQVTIPFVVGAGNKCLEAFNAFQSGKSIPKTLARRSSTSMVSRELQVLGSAYPVQGASFELQNTTRPIIKFGIFDPTKTNLGVIKLTAFEDGQVDLDDLFQTIRNVVMNELGETNALVLDIRENLGGQIALADTLPQLFKPKFVGPNFIALPNPISEKLFKNNFLGPDWVDAVKNFKPGDAIIGPVPFNRDTDTNLFGQAYFKPVGVLNDGVCYSSCDMFSSNMQDNEAGFIFGADGSTGAGGANVIAWNNFFSANDPKDCPPMPFAKELGSFAQDMRVAWRQLVRVGKNQGKLVEDLGVIPDQIVRPTLDDILNNNSKSQFTKIAARLAQLGKDQGNSNLVFKTASSPFSDFMLGDKITYTASVAGIKSLALNTQDGSKNLATVTIQDDANRTNVTLTTPVTQNTTIGFDRFQIIGKNGRGAQNVETYRFVRFIPNNKDWFTLSKTPISWDLSPTSKGVGLYNFPGTGFVSNNANPAAGWNKIGQSLQVGNGSRYENFLNTTVSVFCNPAQTVSMDIKAFIDAESGDALNIDVLDAKGLNSVFNSDKAKIKDLKQTFKFNPQGPFEIKFKFLSGGINVADPPSARIVRIDAVTLTAQ